MRYSKRKIITTAIIAFLCFSAIVFLIIKGINDSKKLTEATLDSKLTASVSNKKEEEKKQNETTNNKNKTKSNEESSSSDEPHVVEIKDKKTVDTSFTGKYIVTELKKGDKEYSKEELDNLKNDGYSLSLTISKKGLATVSVLDLDRQYEVTDNYFDDGNNKIEYSKNVGKIGIKIDDMDILFEKE